MAQNIYDASDTTVKRSNKRNRLKLVNPTRKEKEEAEEFINEFFLYHSQINGTSWLDEYVTQYDAWLLLCEKMSHPPLEGEEWVQADTYFVKQVEDEKIVGMMNIRHQMNSYLQMYGGNIGYCVRPSMRKKGYATELLSLGLDRCKALGLKRVLITCDKSNIGSMKTIRNNLGELENEVLDQETGEMLQRYWIDLQNIKK